jgi:4-alpha-glucanotransferase
MGESAYRFVDLLGRARQHVWQVLPLHPVESAHANSPYSSSSAFAGNRLLICPDQLAADGFVTRDDIGTVPPFPADRVDYDAVVAFKDRILARAWDRFRGNGHRAAYDEFCRSHVGWLDDFALFEVIKRAHDRKPWSAWPIELRDRDPDALNRFRSGHSDEIERVKFEQFLFFRQWTKLKQYANEHDVQIFGDIPLYVNYDSADTWSAPGNFKLDDDRKPTVVAGVPPDYFSKTGQLWGNPVYDWDRLRADGFGWWLRRMEHMFRLYDVVRIDHFRGLVAFWEVPASHKTAVDGTWVDAPVDEFLSALTGHFPELPVVAEDLGTITDDVRDVMKRYTLPGMKILQFAFGEDNPEHPYLPHNFDEDAVVYTGTHDNNTVAGWFAEEATDEDKRRLFEYLGEDVPDDQIHWALMRLALNSDARLAVLPMQDILGLPASARMNTPATRDHNWSWRLTGEQFSAVPIDGLAELVQASGRG